jgi:hypothetical protein
MKRTRLASAALAVLAVPALALSLSAASSQAKTVPSQATIVKPEPATRPGLATRREPATGQPEPVVVDCLGKGQVEPGSFILACADYNSYLTKLHWNSWTPEMASATGTLVQNDCDPYCAIGHFHSYPALVVLWAPQPYGPQHSGPAHDSTVQRFTELTEILPGARPLVYNGHGWVPAQRVETSQLWAPRI